MRMMTPHPLSLLPLFHVRRPPMPIGSMAGTWAIAILQVVKVANRITSGTATHIPGTGTGRETESRGTLVLDYRVNLKPVDRRQTRWTSTTIGRSAGHGETAIASVVMHHPLGQAVAAATKRTETVNGPVVVEKTAAAVKGVAAPKTERSRSAAVPVSAAEIEPVREVEVAETMTATLTMEWVALPTTGIAMVVVVEGEMEPLMQVTAAAIPPSQYAGLDEGMTNGLQGHHRQLAKRLTTGHWRSAWDYNV
jgi:hypothetical protein